MRVRGTHFCGHITLEVPCRRASTGHTLAGQLPARRLAFGDKPPKTCFRTGEIPALGQAISHHEADVVARLRVLAAGVAQADNQPVDGRPAAKQLQELLLGGAAVGGRLAGLAAGLADELRLGFQLALLLGLEARRGDRGNRGGWVVEQSHTLW